MPKTFLDDFEPVYDELRTSLHRETANAQEAADLAQSSVERLLRLPASEAVRSPARLLRRIARNLKIDSIRQRKRLQVESLEAREDAESLPAMACEFSPERILLGQERIALLCGAIDRMPARCREAFILSRIHGLSHEEVAGQMGVSPSMVEKHVALGMRICRESLEQ